MKSSNFVLSEPEAKIIQALRDTSYGELIIKVRDSEPYMLSIKRDYKIVK